MWFLLRACKALSVPSFKAACRLAPCCRWINLGDVGLTKGTAFLMIFQGSSIWTPAPYKHEVTHICVNKAGWQSWKHCAGAAKEGGKGTEGQINTEGRDGSRAPVWKHWPPAGVCREWLWILLHVWDDYSVDYEGGSLFFIFLGRKLGVAHKHVCVRSGKHLYTPPAVPNGVQPAASSPLCPQGKMRGKQSDVIDASL